jgi:electron transport complex protein RnfG
LKETPGLGIKVREDWFRDQFRGKKSEELLLKKDGGELDAVTAATISSRAVVNGVREGIERYVQHLTESEE